MILQDQLNALHKARTPEALHTEYDQACERFQGDGPALTAIIGAVYFSRQKMEKAA